jgi:hypothetical protein
MRDLEQTARAAEEQYTVLRHFNVLIYVGSAPCSFGWLKITDGPPKCGCWEQRSSEAAAGLRGGNSISDTEIVQHHSSQSQN